MSPGLTAVTNSTTTARANSRLRDDRRADRYPVLDGRARHGMAQADRALDPQRRTVDDGARCRGSRRSPDARPSRSSPSRSRPRRARRSSRAQRTQPRPTTGPPPRSRATRCAVSRARARAAVVSLARAPVGTVRGVVDARHAVVARAARPCARVGHGPRVVTAPRGSRRRRCCRDTPRRNNAPRRNGGSVLAVASAEISGRDRAAGSQADSTRDSFEVWQLTMDGPSNPLKEGVKRVDYPRLPSGTATDIGRSTRTYMDSVAT